MDHSDISTEDLVLRFLKYKTVPCYEPTHTVTSVKRQTNKTAIAVLRDVSLQRQNSRQVLKHYILPYYLVYIQVIR